MNKKQEHQLFPVEVLELKEISTGIFILSHKREDDFLAGQVIAITDEPKDQPRLYSIASGVNEKEVRILFNRVPRGRLTEKLVNLKRGDQIYVSRPFGKFTGTTEPAYWIAAGTGIAPFASMFYSNLANGKILIHGGRNLDSFYFKEDFLRVLGKNYIRCCSQEHAPGIFNGRLTSYLKLCNDLSKTHKYYLCGSAEMVVETRDILIEKGIPFSNIIAEIYF